MKYFYGALALIIFAFCLFSPVAHSQITTLNMADEKYLIGSYPTVDKMNPDWIVLQYNGDSNVINCWKAWKLKMEGSALRFDNYQTRTIILSGNFGVFSTSDHLGYDLNRAGKIAYINAEKCQ